MAARQTFIVGAQAQQVATGGEGGGIADGATAIVIVIAGVDVVVKRGHAVPQEFSRHFAVIGWRRGHDQGRRGGKGDVVKVDVARALQVAGQDVARLTGSQAQGWAGLSSARVPRRVTPGKRLRASSGWSSGSPSVG